MIPTADWLQLVFALDSAIEAEPDSPLWIWREETLDRLSQLEYESDRVSSDGKPFDEAACEAVVQEAIAKRDAFGQFARRPIRPR